MSNSDLVCAIGYILMILLIVIPVTMLSNIIESVTKNNNEDC